MPARRRSDSPSPGRRRKAGEPSDEPRPRISRVVEDDRLLGLMTTRLDGQSHEGRLAYIIFLQYGGVSFSSRRPSRSWREEVFSIVVI